MLPQQALMLQVAAGAIDGLPLTDALRERTGVFIGLGLDLNTTNFTFRWSLPEQARAWAEQLGLHLTEAALQKWAGALREAAGPALNANRTMGRAGRHRGKPHRPRVSRGRPQFHPLQRGKLGRSRPGNGRSLSATRRDRPGPGRCRRSGRRSCGPCWPATSFRPFEDWTGRPFRGKERPQLS